MPLKYYVYMLLCSDGTYYTGWSTDVHKRVATHNKGKGAKYTRGRLPVTLLWFDSVGSKSDAMKKEYTIKQLNRKEKIRYINDRK
jgi:putative endonuclease